MKEKGVVSWKLPPREISCQRFCEIFPSENNHVYSNLLRLDMYGKHNWRLHYEDIQDNKTKQSMLSQLYYPDFPGHIF